MRYILDNDGYVAFTSLGKETPIACELGTCTEYNGDIPEGYENLFEWQCNANIRAYKIVDGNLVFDSTRDAELQKQFDIEQENNAPATHKWVKDRLRVSSSVVTDELSSEATGTSLIVIDDAGNYEIPELKVESATVNNVNVVSSNKNILGIDFITETINGVEVKNNGDGTITLNGTSTDVIELDINGSNTNTDMLYLIEKELKYAISGLADNVSLSLYSFDGTDRVYVGNYINQNITLSSSYKITQTILSIPSGATFEEVTIKPQIEIGEATDFIKHEVTKAFGILEDNECIVTGLISYTDKTIIMIDEEVTSSVKYYTQQYLTKKFAEIEVTEKEVKSTVSEMNETIEGQNTAISQISQTVNEIKSEINDIAEITTSADGYGSVYLEKINESEPVYIRIYPSENEDISYIYPSDNLFPSDDLFMKGRTLRFECDDYYIDYELPNDLLYYDEENYDEFILDYDNQKCEVNKKVGYNADGSKYLLETPKTITYEYPNIPLKTGDYTVTMLGYENAYMFIRMMCENIYTNQFATKVELNSAIIQTKDSITSQVKAEYATKNDLVTTETKINQTTNAINLEVSQKVNNKDYTSANIIAKVNNDTSAIQIKASKIDLKGYLTITNASNTYATQNSLKTSGSTIINGDNITTGTISANRLDAKVITTDNFSAQTINADKINGGTISASNIKLTGVSLGTSSSTIGGFKTTSSGFSNNNFSIGTNGVMNLFPQIGSGAIYRLNNGFRVNATSGVCISSNSGETSNFPSANLDLKACSGASAYLGSMINADGTGERSGVNCTNGILKFSSSGYCTYNGSTVFGSSSKATKENIVDLNQEQKDEVYELIKNIPLKQYDYKEEYGKKFNYGFIIEDVEDTKLNDLLHITQSETNTDIKMYSTEDLVRLQLITIQELMSKVEKLENKIKELESDK